MARLLLVDDHAVVRKGLKSILESSDRTIEVEEADCAQDAMCCIRGKPLDGVILDITMPGKHGIDLLKQIKREQPDLPVLILSVHPEEQYGIRVLKAGASGYLTKLAAPEKLLEAVEKILAHKRYISPQLADQLAQELVNDAEHSGHHALSDREYEVLCLIASGKSVTEIAAELCLSVKTIHTYRARVMSKLQLHNNVELARYAVQFHLIE